VADLVALVAGGRGVLAGDKRWNTLTISVRPQNFWARPLSWFCVLATSTASYWLDVLAFEVQRMESQLPFASRDDIWRLQESLNEIATIQGQHTERIMRLEKRRDDDARVKSVWAPTSPYPVGLGGSGPQGKHL
jgi:hypothetical protein